MNPGIPTGDEYPTFHEGGHCFDTEIGVDVRTAADVRIDGCRWEHLKQDIVLH